MLCEQFLKICQYPHYLWYFYLSESKLLPSMMLGTKYDEYIIISVIFKMLSWSHLSLILI